MRGRDSKRALTECSRIIVSAQLAVPLRNYYKVCLERRKTKLRISRRQAESLARWRLDEAICQETSRIKLQIMLEMAMPKTLGRVRRCCCCFWFLAISAKKTVCSDACRFKKYQEKREYKENRKKYMREYLKNPKVKAKRKKQRINKGELKPPKKGMKRHVTLPTSRQRRFGQWIAMFHGQRIRESTDKFEDAGREDPSEATQRPRGGHSGNQDGSTTALLSCGLAMAGTKGTRMVPENGTASRGMASRTCCRAGQTAPD